MPDLAGEKIAYLSFCGTIDSASVSKIANTLNNALIALYDKVYLCISSNGGYVGDGIFLYNHIKGLHIPVITHNTGTVASIATSIFVAGTTRYCTSNSIFMIHPVAMPSGSSTSALESALDAARCDEARIENILKDRTRLPEEILLSRRSRDIYLTPQQALDHGLVAEIKDFSLPAGNQIF